MANKCLDAVIGDPGTYTIRAESKMPGDAVLLVIRDGGRYILNYGSFCNALKGLINSASAPTYVIARNEQGVVIGVSGIMFDKNIKKQIIASGFVVTAREIRGYGVGKALIRYSIDVAEENRAVFIANVDENNMASRKTMESAGMRVESICTKRNNTTIRYTTQ